MNENPVVETVVRKTQVITLWDRQRRMLDYFNLPGTTYIALGKTSAWSDATDESISDTYPPIPSDSMTDVQELIGLQRIQWKKFAKVYVSPTSEQKDDPTTVYYKGLYYETTDDPDKAINEGFTSIMFMITADRDEYFPIGVSFRQAGIYVEVGVNEEYLSATEYNNLSSDKKGHLMAVANYMPLTRQADQMEKLFVCIDC